MNNVKIEHGPVGRKIIVLKKNLEEIQNVTANKSPKKKGNKREIKVQREIKLKGK